jgi:alpha-mannosidase
MQADVTIRALWPIVDAASTDLLEESSRPADVRDGAIRLALEPFEIVTLRARLDGAPASTGARVELAPRAEIAQPVFADYWLHNKGTAPLGYQPVSVQIRPSRVQVSGPFTVPISVASERTDGPVDGSVVIDVPPGWQASPGEQPYRLAPGAHIGFETEITPAGDTASGRYFVAARITDGGQIHEDVVAVDVQTGRDTPRTDVGSRSPTLELAVRRALVTAGIDSGRVTASDREDAMPAEELEAALLDRAITVAPGERARLRLSLRNCLAGEIHGEAQVISPYDTWGFLGPWTQGFAIDPGAETVLEFTVAPPKGTPAGAWWALVKIMYFGRMLYTESIPVEVVSS